MKLVGHHTRKELLVTFTIWLLLLASAVTALVILRNNALDIITHISYVNVSRPQKAEVLYAEAEKNARKVLDESEQLNLESERKVVIPASSQALQKTLSLFEQALQADIRPEFSPDRTMHYELLGQVYDAAGRRTEELLAHARAFMSQNDTADAEDYLEQARMASPDSPEPLLLLAQLHQKNNKLPEALALLEDVYSSYTVTARARWLNGSLLLQAGDTAQAVEELGQALKADEKNLKYRQDLALALAVAAKTAEAAKVMEGGLAYGGWLDGAFLHMYGGYLLAINDLEEAIRVLEQADKLAPYSGDIQWSLAQAYHKAGKARLAAAALRRATEIKPELHDQIF